MRRRIAVDLHFAILVSPFSDHFASFMANGGQLKGVAKKRNTSLHKGGQFVFAVEANGAKNMITNSERRRDDESIQNFARKHF